MKEEKKVGRESERGDKVKETRRIANERQAEQKEKKSIGAHSERNNLTMYPVASAKRLLIPTKVLMHSDCIIWMKAVRYKTPYIVGNIWHTGRHSSIRFGKVPRFAC